MEWWYFLWNGGISYGMVVFLKLNEINNEIWGWGGGRQFGTEIFILFS